MIDLRYKPFYLPQLSAPFNIVLDKLDDDNIEYEMREYDPNELNTSQGITLSSNVGKVKLSDDKPIYVAGENNNVVDGHHRWVKALMTNKPIIAIKINKNVNDACRILNKIQDIYEYENKLEMEEVVAQGNINDRNDINNDYDFLNLLEKDNIELHDNEKDLNSITIVAYRKEPIKDDSVIGNFFTLKPIKGFDKYEIEFKNLLDTNNLGLNLLDSQDPIELLSKLWFPNINFNEISDKYNIKPINLKTKAITNKATKLGYDGVKYGESIIQGLK